LGLHCGLAVGENKDMPGNRVEMGSSGKIMADRGEEERKMRG
jgi:hypothetical protein